jgi:leader peptidase (prepilin peptidase)/N-methyltransferase
MPIWLGAAICFIYGAVVGSFLNVIIYRLPKDESIIYPPSHCPQCDTRLRAWDLAPIFSFLLMGRRCRYCHTPISWRYLGVETLTGLLAVGLYLKYGFSVEFFIFAFFSAALIAVFFIDLDHLIIPDELVIIGIVLGIARDVIGLVMHEPGWGLISLPVPFTGFEVPMLRSIAGMVACGVIFYTIAVVSEWAFKKEAMGGGDIKLAAAVGANLAIMQALLSFFVAVFVGSVIGIGLMVLGRKGRRDYLPFGPMMVIGVWAVLLFYTQLIAAWEIWNRFITGAVS